MKKLLSLLSVLTISGTAVPTTIAASPYQKEEHNTETDSGVSVFYQIIENGKRKSIIEKIYGVNENESYIRFLGFDNRNNKYYINDKNIYFVNNKNNNNNAISIKLLSFKPASVIDFSSTDNFVRFNWKDLNNTIHVYRIKIIDLENNNLNKINELSKIISNPILGTVKINNEKGLLTEQQIKDFLKDKNPQLDITKIGIKNIIDDLYNNNEKRITVFSSDSTIYTGEATVFLDVEK
ncbi:hypothetical protein [Spiroplasma endosymbiont of Sarcophaga variegata]|uniref:hypothetical protein n=1 Tax=Spiroplasma endosymbiont of Sarcophaga variegata TaxID=3066304 RepID=UPI003AF75ED0